MTEDRTADALGTIADRLDDLWQLLDARLPPSEVMDDAAIARIKAAVMDCVAQNASQDGENAPLAGVGHDQASYTGSAAADASEPAQTLADLTPCLGDRVRVSCRCCRTSPKTMAVKYLWDERARRFGWTQGDGVCSLMNWTVLEHLDPVTPEEPPVGAGMLVDRKRRLRIRLKDGRWMVHSSAGWMPSFGWGNITDRYGPLRPATPADLAEHGVDEDGEPVGKGEADDEHLTAACDWSDFRKDYGVSSDPELMQREHRAFLAGWQAGRHGDQSGVLR